MGKLLLLFLAAVALLGIGAYLRQNPAWLQKYRGSFNASPQSSVFKPVPTGSQSVANWPTYHSQTGRFSISYPPNWHEDASVPGCGPTFFAPNTKQIWLNICGPDNKVNQTALSSLAQKSRRSQATMSDVSSLTVGGHTSYRQTQTTPNAVIYQLFLSGVPLTATGSGVVEISLTDSTNQPDTSLSSTFQQIIDSLQIE